MSQVILCENIGFEWMIGFPSPTDFMHNGLDQLWGFKGKFLEIS